MLRLGGPEPHGRRSGVVHILTDSEARGPRAGPHRRGAARRARAASTSPASRTATCRRCCRSRRSAPTTCTRWSSRCSTRAPCRSCTSGGRPTSSPRSAGFGGRTVGVVANNPLRLGGCLDSLSAEKASRFVRMCDAFGVPLIVLVDVPGYLPGVGQEWDGVVRRGAKLLHAFGECVVPRVTLITRKTYGGAYIAMNARSLGATKVFAWPGAEVAVMGAGRRGPDPAPAQAGRGRPRHPPAGRGRAGRRARADRRRRRARRSRSAWSTRSSSPTATRAAIDRRPGVRPGRRAEGGRGPRPARQHPPRDSDPRSAVSEAALGMFSSAGLARAFRWRATLTSAPGGGRRDPPDVSDSRRGAAPAHGDPEEPPHRHRALLTPGHRSSRTAAAQTTLWSQRTGAPSPAWRNVSSSSSHGLPSSLSISSEQRGVAERGLDHGGLEPVLGDHDVAVQAGHGVEDAQVGRVGVPRAPRWTTVGSSVTSKRRWFQPRSAEAMAAAVPGSPHQDSSAR